MLNNEIMLRITSFGPIVRFDLARSLGGRGRYWTTAYLVDRMMIDTGCAHCAAELLRELQDIHLKCITNTHTHEDHIGANGPLQRRQAGIPVLAHPLALPILADPRRTQPLHLYRQLFWGWPEPSLGCPLPSGVEVKTDHYCFEVIHTPGHSPDHLCLYEPRQGWLFTGDLFVGGRDRALRAGYDIWEIIASLKKVAALPISILFPGSARVRENPAEELRGKIDYLEELGEKVLQLHERGMSVRQITQALCGGLMLVEIITLGNFSRRRLVLSYLNMNAE